MWLGEYVLYMPGDFTDGREFISFGKSGSNSVWGSLIRNTKRRRRKIKRLLTICEVAVLLLALSGLAYALTTTGWMEYTSNPVYAPGKAYYPSILKEGNTYRMWSDNASGVQMAISTDGINWTTAGQASGLLNPRHTVVEKIGNEYRMWYDDGSDAHLYSIEAIRTATSSDGLSWDDDQPITQVDTTVITGTYPSWNTGSYGPCDILYNPAGSATIVEPVDKASVWANKFVMYYNGTTGADEFLGLAVSNDGLNWQGYNGGLAPVLDSTDGAWDSRYVGFGTVIRESDDVFHLWYSGGSDYSLNNGIGYAFSTDGITWIKDAGNPIFHKGDGVGWRDDRTYTPMVIGDQMWFSGKDANTDIYAIGYATAPCTPVSIDYLTEGPLLAQVNTEVSFEATIVGGCGQIDALWDFDDGTFDSQTNVTSPVTATNTYASPGLYNVVLSLSDDSGSGVAGGNLSVVVYDPTGGFVTGGGWIDSPLGAYTAEPTLTGRVNFGFVSKYKKGANVPTGNTKFIFQAADLNFHSSSYQWLVVTQGGSRAQFKGSGTINSTGDYKFMLRAGDGEPDTFWIQIWEERSDEELLIYDNGSDQSIGGGSIIVHKGKK